MRKNTILIAGPTASGKSGLALRIARQCGGVIVNADSMQVYDVLRVLTARPSVEEEQAAAHMLFGHVPPSVLYSSGSWLADVKVIMKTPELAGRPLVFAGGTGLYFRALLGGLSQMPEIPADIRAHWRAQLAEKGPVALHDALQLRDEEAFLRLKPQDGQRIVRALEVFEASGRPISFWQRQKGSALADEASARKICLDPPRQELRARIDARFRLMAARGAVEEVRALRKLGLDQALPAMKAIGVEELGRFLDGKASLDDAVELACASTRQYAKRQSTWMRHQLGPGWERFAHADAPVF